MKKFVFAVLVSLGIAIFFSKDSFKTPSPSELSRTKVKLLREEVAEAVKNEGFESAYARYMEEYPEGSMIGHAADHFFGEILYEEQGLAGIAGCGDQYGSGCRHDIVFKEIEMGGNAALNRIIEKCQELGGKATVGCNHALGHTLLEIKGDEHLGEVLTICEKQDGEIKPHGCIGGAIMQYFFPALYSPFSSQPQFKDFIVEMPYVPCMDLPERFKDVCFYSLPEWWSSSLNRNYGKIQNLCVEIETKDFVKPCFLGLGGSIASDANWDVKVIKKICGEIQEVRYQNWCLAGAAWPFDVNLVCGQNPICRKEADTAFNLYH